MGILAVDDVLLRAPGLLSGMGNSGNLAVDWNHRLLKGPDITVAYISKNVPVLESNLTKKQPFDRIGPANIGVFGGRTGMQGDGQTSTNATRWRFNDALNYSHATVLLFVPADVTIANSGIHSWGASATDSQVTQMRNGVCQNGDDIDFVIRRAVRATASNVLTANVPVVIGYTYRQLFIDDIYNLDYPQADGGGPYLSIGGGHVNSNTGGVLIAITNRWGGLPSYTDYMASWMHHVTVAIMTDPYQFLIPA